MQIANEVVPRAHKEIKLTPADEARFWKKVDKSAGPDACWLWTAGKTSRGYGQFKVSGVMFRAHRIAWTLTKGPIPNSSDDGLSVCHKCDVPACCNPAHHFLGTAADNSADREAKGRGNQVSGDAHHARTNPERMARGDRHGSRLHPERMSHGEAHSSAKLTAAQVVEIRNLYAKGQTTYSQLVTRYCISRSVISAIILRKNWKHV